MVCSELFRAKVEGEQMPAIYPHVEDEGSAEAVRREAEGRSTYLPRWDGVLLQRSAIQWACVTKSQRSLDAYDSFWERQKPPRRPRGTRGWPE